MAQQERLTASGYYGIWIDKKQLAQEALDAMRQAFNEADQAWLDYQKAHLAQEHKKRPKYRWLF